MTDTLSKYYIHSLDLKEQLRDELEFSDPERIRMYSDNERLGIRLKPFRYNQSARKVEFPNSVFGFEVVAPLPVKPNAVNSFSIAYDSARNVVVLFGGTNGPPAYTYQNETWEFDGVAWNQVTTATVPTARVNSAMVFDSVRNVVVMFGGYDGSILNETWEYDGVDWSLATPATNPGPHYVTHIVFDESRSRVVLFGGSKGGLQNPSNETWEYDGVDWSQVVTAESPVARRFAAFAYDKNRKRVVLFGGMENVYPNETALNDTWEYDGSDWVKLYSEQNPKARWYCSGFYDENLKSVVIVGGVYDYKNPVDYNTVEHAKDVWGFDGVGWFTVITSGKRRDLIANIVYNSQTGRAFYYGGDNYSGTELYAETVNVGLSNVDITCRLPLWSPQAVKGWDGFEEASERKPGLIVQWRVSDGTDDYWFDGSVWVIASKISDWNTDLEVSANIQAFPHTQKKIQFICRLISASRWKTPVMLGTRLLMTASFDWFEDLVLRSLVPRIEEDFTFLMDWSGVLEADSDRFNIKTDYPFTPEEDLNVIGIESVYDETTDPNYETNLLQSFDPVTGEAILTGTLPAGTRLFYRLNVAPEVAVNFTNTDYDEIGKTPVVIIDQISFQGRQVEAFNDMALKDRLQGAKFTAPLWVERMVCNCVLLTGKIVNSLRLMTKAYSFVVRGATQQPGHKPGGILKTKALDLEHTLKIVPVSRYNPKPQFSDLKEATFEIYVCDFYAWLRDMEQTALVTRFNPSVEDMAKAGTGNPDKKQPLPAGAIPSLYRTPEVEEV